MSTLPARSAQRLNLQDKTPRRPARSAEKTWPQIGVMATGPGEKFAPPFAPELLAPPLYLGGASGASRFGARRCEGGASGGASVHGFTAMRYCGRYG